jgi:pyridoxal phosphate enzyme (YggS family)
LSSAVKAVTANIRHAAEAADRDPDEVRLVAASKTVPADRLLDALNAGVKTFGENRVQEAVSKWPQIRVEFPEVELHLIGPLQSNKASIAVRLFDVIQSLDTSKLAQTLVRCRDNGATLPRLLCQVNIGQEPQKAGVLPEDVERFVRDCQLDHGLELIGLMCIPPQGEDPTPYFIRLAHMRDRLGVEHCSMGMSGDYVEAIRYGATMVRVGSRIFGGRMSL